MKISNKITRTINHQPRVARETLIQNSDINYNVAGESEGRMQLSVVAHPMSDHRVGAAERGDIGLTMFSSPQKNENSFFFLITPKE